MAKMKSKLCRYCKGTISFTNDSGFTKWGIRCELSGLPHFRSFDTEEQAQRSIDEWCTGDGRRGCRPYLLRETGHSYTFGGDLLREFEAKEEATVAKQKYYCKCGKTFEKSSTASDTGYRMDDYGPEHECYGCPFVEEVTEGWGQTLCVKAHECRASDGRVNYKTGISIALDSDCVAKVYTLDFPWLDHFINFFLDTPGCGRSITNRDPDALEKAFRNSYLFEGRRSYSFEFEKNKRGRAARKIVYDEFFDENGRAFQLGCGPPEEKVRILQMIEFAKQVAREAEIFAAEEEDTEVKIQAPTPDGESCPYYKGIQTAYSPKGYCIDCTVRHGCDRTPYDLKSWALDAVNKLCIGEDNYCKCHFYGLAQQGATDIEPLPSPAPTQQPPEAVPAIPRNIADVTAEIRLYKAQTVQNIIEIGKRLNEAKALLEHGQWGEWLRNEVEFSQDTAGNFMRIAEEYPNSEPVRNLSYTKLVTLLSLPTPIREEFMESTHTVDGVDKTVDEMSKRELQKVMKERDEAKTAAAQSQNLAILSNQVVENQTTTINELRQRNQRLQSDLDELEKQPRDTPYREVPSDTEINVLRQNIRHEVMQSLALPDTYFAKKGTEQAEELFVDAIGGATANGLIALMRMDAKAAAKTMRVYISTLEKSVRDLNDRLNIMLQVDRSAKEGADDVDW